MNGELNGKSVGFLKYLVYFLLVLLTLAMTWQGVVMGHQGKRIDDLRNEYVRVERYKADTARIEQGIRDLNQKFDKWLILRGVEP